MITPIGGYFELELCKGEHYHKNAICLNTARNCLEYVLRTRCYKKIFIPYYTCEVILEPITKLGLQYDFYTINDILEPVSCPKLEPDEAFLYTNYFGLKRVYVKQLALKYGSQLIVDNAQAFYAESITGIDTFYSARKFFGVSDGAYLYTTKTLQNRFEQDDSFKRCSHLLKRIDIGAEAGYCDFRENDDSLNNQDIKEMSKLTSSILSGIDYEYVRQKRRENYTILNDALNFNNLIHLKLESDAVPMVYPYLTEDKDLKQKLIDNKIFVATYWSKLYDKSIKELREREFADRLLPLPCDQRYGNEEMARIIKIILG